MRDLAAIFGSIDRANERDPNQLPDGPLALVQGRLGTKWLERLAPNPSAELQVAVRAHHLRRWELRRADFPEGRAGYLAWRRANKAHQAEAAQAILEEAQWSQAEIDRVGELLLRTRLRSDSETQALEDAACLVFLETQFDDLVERTEHDHMVNIVVKTLRKMSDGAIALAGELSFGASAHAVLADAIIATAALGTTDA